MIQYNNTLSSTTANNINILSSSQTKATQNASQPQQDETKSQNTDVSAAYSVEISHEGASLHSQSSLASTVASDIEQNSSSSVKTSQVSSQPQQAETSSQQTDSSTAYSVEISQAGADALKSSALPDKGSSKPSTSAPTSTPTTVSSDSSDSSSTGSLSQYSDSQLQQMISDGKISQSEYNTEIASRKAKEEIAKNGASTNNLMGNTDVSKSA